MFKWRKKHLQKTRLVVDKPTLRICETCLLKKKIQYLLVFIVVQFRDDLPEILRQTPKPPVGVPECTLATKQHQQPNTCRQHLEFQSSLTSKNWLLAKFNPYFMKEIKHACHRKHQVNVSFSWNQLMNEFDLGTYKRLNSVASNCSSSWS